MAAHGTDDLIHDHLTLASRLARGFRGRGVEADDLDQVARLALVKAAHGYDAERGAFAPFAAATIRGELKRHFRDHAWQVRPPRRIQELQASLNGIANGPGRDRDAASLAREIGADVHEIREAQAARGCFRCDSTDAAEEAGSGFGTEDRGFAGVDDWVTFCRLCQDLDATDRQLLVWRFMDELTQRQIGDRLGISQMQVSRRLSALLARMRASADLVA